MPPDAAAGAPRVGIAYGWNQLGIPRAVVGAANLLSRSSQFQHYTWDLGGGNKVSCQASSLMMFADSCGRVYPDIYGDGIIKLVAPLSENDLREGVISYRHSGKTATACFLDGHVASVRLQTNTQSSYWVGRP